MRTDYLQLMLDESRDLASYLATLSPDDWDMPSLCAGWRVRDVVAHMAVGHSMSLLAFGGAVARGRFRVDAASYRLATSYADSHSASEVLALFSKGTQGPPRGAARWVPAQELFTDHLVHHQDIRRPLAAPRELPAERGLAALQTLSRLSSRIGSRRRLAGLHVVATDVPFEHRDGAAELRGTAEALVMALTGRADVLPELSGPGTRVLAARLAATPSGSRAEPSPR
jgi:uncharacterized protein (TIGR03083 family)